MRHLAAAGGMADVNSVFEIEMRGQCGQVIGIVIHVVTVAHLRGTTMAAAVMRDDAIAVIEEEQHLRVPIVGRQRPAMTEHDGLTFAPVLVVDLNAVFGRDVHDAPLQIYESTKDHWRSIVYLSSDREMTLKRYSG